MILSIGDYLPGKALNKAINQASGNYIAILSAHSIPARRNWLATLYAHMQDPNVAGVYGAQLYPINSKFLDKRDLDIFARNQSRIEREDSDFWNANSMFPRILWEMQPFDERVFELEDHHWTKMILPLGYEIHFEPQALVYHYGHIDRNDREYPPNLMQNDRERIDAAIDVLEKNGSDWTETMIAGLTLSSLTHSGHIRRAVDALGQVLRNHWDFDVRWRVAGALGKIPCKESVLLLIGGLSDRSFYARDEAAWSLARLGNLAVNPIINSIDQLDQDSLPFAALALGMTGDEFGERYSITLLAKEIKSGDKVRIRNAIYFAGEIVKAQGATDLVTMIAEFLDDNDDWLVAVCCWALGCFSEVCWELIKWEDIRVLAMRHSDEIVRFEATVALGKVALVTGNPDFISSLSHLLHDQNDRVRYGAVQSLRMLIQERKINVKLDSIIDDTDFGIRHELKLIKKLLQ
jgi:HEAT repeat protein